MPEADLVLEGGGVTGLGAAGAVMALLDAGYPFPRVAGTSVGALAGDSIHSWLTTPSRCCRPSGCSSRSEPPLVGRDQTHPDRTGVRERTMTVDTRGTATTGFGIGAEERGELIARGEQAAREFLERREGRTR